MNSYKSDGVANIIDVGNHKQLFFDDKVIAEKEQVYRLQHQAEKSPAPLLQLSPRQEIGGSQLSIVSGSVIYDDEEHKFKMWYEAVPYYWKPAYLGYAESDDGINWQLPNSDVVTASGNEYRNLLFTGSSELAPAVFKDHSESDPQRRYKMLYRMISDDGIKVKAVPGKMDQYYQALCRVPDYGIGTAFSPDGIHWQRGSRCPVIPFSDSPNSVMVDPRSGKYITHNRKWETCRLADGSMLDMRVIMQYESDDFQNWCETGVIMRPDDKDPLQSRQFYNMEWLHYEGMDIGFIAIYHTLLGMEPDYPEGIAWLDTVDIQLAYSDDGKQWRRVEHNEPFLPVTAAPRSFDHSQIYVMQSPIVYKDEIRIYYVGLNGRHWSTVHQEYQGGAVGLATLRLDGFVSMSAGNGRLTTRYLLLQGEQLLLNAECSKGEIKVEVLGLNGEPIAGYSATEAVPFSGDNLRHQVCWRHKMDLTELRGSIIALRFYIRSGHLYAFTFIGAEDSSCLTQMNAR